MSSKSHTSIKMSAEEREGVPDADAEAVEEREVDAREDDQYSKPRKRKIEQ